VGAGRTISKKSGAGDMGKYTLNPVNDDNKWDAFIETSRQGTLFSLSDYLRFAVNNYRRFWIKKGKQIKAGLVFVSNADGTQCIFDDLVIYSGLMFVDNHGVKPTKARAERFRITEVVIDWLTENFSKIQLTLAPQFEDLRPFSWHNYHSNEPNDHFYLNLHYTSYLDITSIGNHSEEEESSCFKGLETIRQRNIRQARKDNAGYVIEKNGSLFTKCYKALMEAQSIEVSNEKISRMADLIDGLIEKGKAKMLISKNGKGESLYATVFGWDSKRAYYLFGAPFPDASEHYKGTIAFWDFFHVLASQGINFVDMEGVNSPNRGRFKLGFGGDLRPYYKILKV